MCKMSAFRFDARREYFVKSRNSFADCFIRQIVTDSLHTQPLSDPIDSVVLVSALLKLTRIIYFYSVCT